MATNPNSSPFWGLPQGTMREYGFPTVVSQARRPPIPLLLRGTEMVALAARQAGGWAEPGLYLAFNSLVIPNF